MIDRSIMIVLLDSWIGLGGGGLEGFGTTVLGKVHPISANGNATKVMA